MKKIITRFNYFPLIVLFFLLGCARDHANQETTQPQKVEIAPGWSKTSVNATIFRKNSIVSYNGFQYAAFYDSTATVVLAKRALDSKDWEIHKTQYKGNVQDAHNVISIMIDGNGYLHMAWDHHGHPLNYCKSEEPESLTMGPKEKMIGTEEDRVTYPQFFRLNNGDMIFAYRDGSSGDGNLLLNYYDLANREWRRLQDNLVSGEGERNAYWQMHIDNHGTFHLSWVWRETPDVVTNHDMGYARSTDQGQTWKRSTGEQYDLPITEETAEYALKIPQNSKLINQTTMTADARGNPYIATYFQQPDDEAPQYYVIYKENDQWKTTQASQRTQNFDFGGRGSRSIPISRPKLLFEHGEEKGRLHLIYRDDALKGRVSHAHAETGNTMTWKTDILTNQSWDRWEPTYDTELWRQEQKLHLFLQKVGQGAGETAVDMPPQMVYIYELPIN